MTAYDAGTAWLQIVPSFRGVDGLITSEVRKWNEQIRRGLEPALPEALRAGARTAGAEGAKAGEQFGGGFARTVRTRIEAALKALPKVELKADSSEAEVKLAAIRAELEDLHTKRIGVDIDEGLALAQLGRLQAELDRLGAEDPSIGVRIDAASASEELARIQAEVNHLDGQTANVHVRVDREEVPGVGGLAGGVGLGGFGLGEAGIAAAPLAVPIGAAAVGGLAGVASAAGAGLAGLGVLGLGLSGITKAVQDISAANMQAGATATASGAAQIRAALAVAAADRQVKSAEDGLAQARANAADAAINAQERVEAALRAQAVAERNLTTAQQNQQAAQQALTQARKTAAEQLQDLNSQITDGQLSLRQGQLDVTNARLNLQNVNSNPLSTQQQRQQAQLDYEQAVQRLKELQTQQQRLGDAQKDAVKKGIEGSDVVVQAQKNLAQATLSVRDAYTAQVVAEQAVSDARRQQAATLRQSAYAIEQAQNSVLSAQAAAQSAALQSATAGGALQGRLAAMSAPLRAFATFIDGTLRPAFDKLRTAVQGALLPKLQTGLSALLPVMPALTRFAVGLADTMGRLFVEASKALTAPFWKGFFDFIGRTAGPVLETMAHSVGNLITGFAGLLQAFWPVSKGIGDGILGLTQRFADFGQHLGSNSSFQAFLAYVKREGPAVAHFFGDLFAVAGQLIRGLAPLGGMLLHLTSKTLDLIKQLGPEGLLLAIGAIGTAIALLGGPVTATVAAVTALAGAAAYAYEQFKPFHDFVHDHVMPTLQKLGESVLAGVRDAWAQVSAAIQRNKPELQQILRAFRALMTFIVDRVLPVLGPVLKGVLQSVGTQISTVIDVVGLLVRAFNNVRSGINTFVGFVARLPDRIKVATRGMWNGIVSSFKAAINSIIRIWNDLSFSIKLPKSAFGVPIPGGGHSIGIDTPNIDYLAAGGAISGPGTWTSDTAGLFRLSNGEHVWPAREVAALGGQQAMYNLRRVLTGYADGGAVGGRNLGTLLPSMRTPALAQLDTLGGGRGDLYYEQHLHYPMPDSVGHGQLRAQQLLLHDLSNR